MSKPLYLLRAERAGACESLIELLSWHVDQANLAEDLDHFVCCDDKSDAAADRIETAINKCDRRTRGELLGLWQDVIDSVREIYNAERQEVAELIACQGRVA